MQITEENLTRFDQTQLYLTYERWPDFFKDAVKIGGKLDHSYDFYKSIVLCGLGGSATNCDIINDIMQVFGIIPCTVLHFYIYILQKMPCFVFDDCK